MDTDQPNVSTVAANALAEPVATISFKVGGLPPLPNARSKAHWSIDHGIKKEWTKTVNTLAKAKYRQESLRGIYDKAHVHYHISVGTTNRIDSDNLNWAVSKPSNDGLVGVFIPDDNIDVLTNSFSYDREAAGFVITITGS
jgi:hypothetical protein